MKEKSTNMILTKTKFLNELLERKEEIETLKNLEFEDFKFSETQSLEMLDKYVSFLLATYNPKKIIMIRNCPVSRHLNDEQNKFQELNSVITSTLTQRFNRFYDYIESKIPNMNVIHMPRNVMGSAQHTWGLDSLHLCDEYYKYLEEAISIIVEKRSDQEERLQHLRDMYSCYFQLLEDKKALTYYMKSKITDIDILKNSNLNVKDSKIEFWNASFSKDAKFDSGILSSGNERENWAILSQTFNYKKYRNSDMIFSVRFKSVENSVLNIAVRYKDQFNKLGFIKMKQICSIDEKIEFLNFKIDGNIPEDSEVMVSLYINEANAKVQIFETRLEEGQHSSLFIKKD